MRKDFFSTREGRACNREIRRRLGQALQATYQPAVSESLPEQLANLLHRLEAGEGESAAGRRPTSNRSDC